jgi:hypothetical protein
MRTPSSYQRSFEISTWWTQKVYVRTTTSTVSCAVATRLRLQRLYIKYIVCRSYSSLGRNGSKSTTPCIATTHLPVASALHQLRCAAWLLAIVATPALPRLSRVPWLLHAPLLDLLYGRTGSTSATPCAATSPTATSALPRLRRLSWLLHALPLDLLYSRTGSTSAMPCAATTSTMATSALPRIRRAPWLHRLPVALRQLLTSTSVG